MNAPIIAFPAPPSGMVSRGGPRTNRGDATERRSAGPLRSGEALNGLRIAFFVGVLIQATSSLALSQSLQSPSLPDEVEAMSLILQNISDITLYECVPDPRDDRLIPWNTPLVRVLATHLLSNDHLSGSVGETAILTNTSISITEHKRSAERIHAMIQLILGDGDYLRSESGYVLFAG